MERIRVHDKYFQPAGMETGRTLRHALLATYIPMGNSASHADRKSLIKMWLVHHCGLFVFPLLVRHEHRLNRIYLLIRRLRS